MSGNGGWCVVCVRGDGEGGVCVCVCLVSLKHALSEVVRALSPRTLLSCLESRVSHLWCHLRTACNWD